MKASLIYITAKDRKEAKKIGAELVKSRLASCVNIISGMNSIYRWEGRIRQSKEAILIAKTKTKLVDKLIKKVKSIHSYSCPCIIALAISKGNKQYLDWIEDETI